MKKFRKLVASLLAVMMILGVAPVAAFAEELPLIEQPAAEQTVSQSEEEIGVIDLVGADGNAEIQATNNSGVTTVIACSDFQHPSGDSTGAQIVTNILNAIKNDGNSTADGFICAGDYSYGYSENQNALSGHLTYLKNAVEGVYGTSLHETYVQGNHEKIPQGTGGLTGPGAHDANGYGVYVIDEDDYMWYNNDEARIQQTATNLGAYLAAKVTEKYTKPIFVVSHLPLHYSMRTMRDGDGQYANYIFDVLNAAGENGLNIIFLYGHNHSHGWDDYLGGSRVYLAKGDEIVIGQGSKTSYATKTLNFTYMNAGYTGYYSYNGNDKIDSAMGESAPLTMTLFKITDTQVTVSRYGRNGKEALKNEGHAYGKCDYYTISEEAKNGCPTNSLTYNSDQYIALSEVRDLPAITINGTPVSKYKVDRAKVEKLAVAVQNFDGYSVTISSKNEKIAKVDAVNEGYTLSFPGETGTVEITATGTAATRAAGDSISATLNLTVTDSNAQPSERTYTRITSTSELEGGKQYLIIYTGGYFVLPEVNSGDSSRVGFKLESTGLGGSETITGDYTAKEWTFEASGNDWKLKNGTQYAKFEKNGTRVNAVLRSLGDDYKIAGTDTFTFSDTSYSNGEYSFNYNDNAKVINGYEGNPAYFYIYKLTSGGNTNPEPVEPVGETIHLYVGDTASRTINGEYYTAPTSNSNPTVVEVAVSGTKETTTPDKTVQTATEAEVTVNQLYNAPGTYYYKVSENNYKPIYAERTNNGWDYTYTWYWKNLATGKRTKIREQTVDWFGTNSTLPNITVYNKPTTTTVSGSTVPAVTDITFTAKAVGTSVVKFGDNTYTIIVRDRAALTDYPEYPNEGSVRVNKTATSDNFQKTGVAKVELSTTGVPMEKGVDVILMLDTSSSMKYNEAGVETTVTTEQRIYHLRNAVANMLETFNKPDATTGKVPDIRVAIADFNTYAGTDSTRGEPNSPLLIGDNDCLDGMTTGFYAKKSTVGMYSVFTGTNDYTAGAFVSASTYDTVEKRTALVNNITAKSGTNYDAAFYYTYQLGEAIRAKNAKDGVDRDLYVVFMSDGAPYQYNFFHAHSGNGQSDTSSNRATTQEAARNWNKWLCGDYATADNVPATNGAHKYFYNENGNRNWWAEAIKGSQSEKYTVIDKQSTENYGGNQYMKQVYGLDAKMYSIGFCLYTDGQVQIASMVNVLQKIATDSTYYHQANNASELKDAFNKIAVNIKKAGYNATFTDKMGDAYDLKITPIADLNGSIVATPSITISTYELYKSNEVGTIVNGTLVTAEMVGTRKNNMPALQETVTFNTDGTAAYSDKIGNGAENILSNNKINAKFFTYDFTTETFSWNVGDITEDEQVLSYYVYLNGSLEGKRPQGSYPTNESAVLTYKNWLDHDAHKDTVSPVMPWGGANVSYAFYLVNQNGEPVVNQGTGETGSFTNAVKVTQPVVHSEVNLNGVDDVYADLVAQNILPAGYTLFDGQAEYNVGIKSDGTGSWRIKKGTTVATTYVAQYDLNDNSKVTKELDSANENNGHNDYTHTIVWFAVKYQVSTVPDAVVIDFGLPVDISVLANDILGDGATVGGLAASVPEGVVPTGTLASGFAAEYIGTNGTATIVENSKKVRYTPTNMEMSTTEKFAYAAKADIGSDTNYYYSTVTVIPAANVYYEDSFITFNNNGAVWEAVGNEKTGITQQEDRPGKFSLAAYDANNVYGFDAAYKDCSTFSLGSAKKVTVNSGTNANAPTAVFTFKGTGFDLISLTSNKTGTILIDVVGDNGIEKHWIVDTYYGYERTVDPNNAYLKYTWTYNNDDGQWHVVKEEVNQIPDGAVLGGAPAQSGDVTYENNYKWTVVTDSDNALYQIPVIRGQGLDYGTYTVTVTPKYSTMFDHAGAGSYDFYLDAVRIYDPAGTNPGGEIGDAYKADGEGWPDIIEIRNNIINASTLSVDQTSANGIVFVDGVSAATFEDYNNYGPNNEVYLAKGQAIAFKLNVADYSNIDSIQIAAKAPAGTSAIAQVSNGTPTPIVSATEMYYTITHRITWSGNTSDTIVVANTGEGLLSLTNIKITYKEASESNIKVMADNRLLQEAPAILMDMLGIEAPVEEKTFEPEMLEASWNRSTVRKGDKATLTVKASEDVEAIEVDGTKIDSYRTRSYRTGWGRNAKKVTYREFNYSITAAESKEFAVTALNEEGTASAPVITEFKVKPKSNRPIRDWFDDLFGRWR